MVQLIFTLKYSFVKHFSFKKKVDGSVQYTGVLEISKNSLP